MYLAHRFHHPPDARYLKYQDDPCRRRKNVFSATINRLENKIERLVFSDSNGEILSRLAPGRDLVVASTLISQFPTVTVGVITCPSIEIILVEVLCDNALHTMTDLESYSISATVFDRYAMAGKTLLRCAGRRNKKGQIAVEKTPRICISRFEQ